MEGNLKKWTNLIKRWQSRYFKLKEGILSYYDKKGGELKGTIHMRICKISYFLKNL